MKPGDKIGFGLYTERAFLTIRDMLAEFASYGTRTYRTYETVRSLEIRRFPDGEVGAKLNFVLNTPFYGDAGPDSVKAWTAKAIRRALSTPRLKGAAFVGEGRRIPVREARFVASAVSGKRIPSGDLRDVLVGSRRDEVETELYRHAEEETARIQAAVDERIKEVKRRIDRGKDAVYDALKRDLDTAFNRYLSEKDRIEKKKKKSNDRLHAEFMAAMAGLRRKGEEDSRAVYEKYGIRPPAANLDGRPSL